MSDSVNERGARCHDCDDGGHPAGEHCWYEGDICTCGDRPLWGRSGTKPCPLDRGEPRPVARREWCPVCHEYYLDCDGCGEAMVTEQELLAGLDEEPANEHTLGCNIWTTNRKPCNCRLTTAGRLDQLCPVEAREAS